MAEDAHRPVRGANQSSSPVQIFLDSGCIAGNYIREDVAIKLARKLPHYFTHAITNVCGAFGECQLSKKTLNVRVKIFEDDSPKVFVTTFKVLRKFPRGMKMFLGLKSCLSTAVLANIGDVRRRFSGRFPLNNGKWAAGNILVERITGVAPVRPNTRAAVSIGEYAGELSISLRTDAAAINVADSQRFLGEFVEDLERLASEVSDEKSR